MMLKGIKDKIIKKRNHNSIEVDYKERVTEIDEEKLVRQLIQKKLNEQNDE